MSYKFDFLMNRKTKIFITNSVSFAKKVFYSYNPCKQIAVCVIERYKTLAYKLFTKIRHFFTKSTNKEEILYINVIQKVFKSTIGYC